MLLELGGRRLCGSKEGIARSLPSDFAEVGIAADLRISEAHPKNNERATFT